MQPFHIRFQNLGSSNFQGTAVVRRPTMHGTGSVSVLLCSGASNSKGIRSGRRRVCSSPCTCQMFVHKTIGLGVLYLLLAVDDISTITGSRSSPAQLTPLSYSDRDACIVCLRGPCVTIYMRVRADTHGSQWLCATPDNNKEKCRKSNILRASSRWNFSFDWRLVSTKIAKKVEQAHRVQPFMVSLHLVNTSLTEDRGASQQYGTLFPQQLSIRDFGKY
jgi:hypothetical protein